MIFLNSYLIVILLIIPTVVLVEKEMFFDKKGPVRTPYAYKNKHFEIIIPKRINSKAQHLTYSMKHYYNEKDDQEDKDVVHLAVPIAGQHHHVRLRPSRTILSPGMIVETFKHSRRSEMRKPNSLKSRRCHFNGKVKGHRHSRAALSTCNGLSGYIQTNNGLFMIEPQYIRDHGTDEPHPHVVYRHPNDENNLFCALSSPQHDEPLKRKRIFQRANPALPPAPDDLHVETLVVLDQTLIRYHKDIDIENYVLTAFNIAHDLFHDSTLGVNINLAIVRLIRLEVEDHEMNIAVTHNAGKTMQYFRNWQKRINPKEDTHPNHHDMAVLITRIDICSDDKTCGFVGAARFGGMCDPGNEAIIAQDNGLLLGYTIAHEIGHTLNLIHDVKPDIIDLDLKNFKDEISSTVMSPHITTGIVEWSSCSRSRLSQFIDYGFGSCLYDPPTEHSFLLADTLPGVMYDADYQCKTLFGPNAALCMTGLECDNLICYVEDKGCIESHQGPADGTSCGENKWCFHGECVEVGERPNAVHGDWGKWSEWSECTRTCGSGVSSQIRQCNNPAPKNGGKFCDGQSVRYKICTTEPCDLDQPSFRDIQCAEFNSWVYPGDGIIHQWKTYSVHDENPCALYCVSENGNIASLRPRVIDGTTCYRGIRDICINGMCKEIPCDLDLESGAVEDRCGLCKGDGTSCDVISGETRLLCGDEKEKKVMTIPSGAMNIKIEEMMPSETRVQVRDQSGMSIYIDGDMLGMYSVHGSQAWVGMIRTKQEAISIQGPINEKIAIWATILQNSTLKYSYGVRSNKKRSPAYSWDYLDWSACSTECGPGVQESLSKCVEKESGLVDESYCKNITRLKAQMRPCEIAPCNSRWFVGDWGPCMHCPLGMRTRIVKCYKPIGIGESELDFIADYFCANNKPKVSEFCSCKRSKRQEVVTVTSSPAQITTKAFVGSSTVPASTTAALKRTTNILWVRKPTSKAVTRDNIPRAISESSALSTEASTAASASSSTSAAVAGSSASEATSNSASESSFAVNSESRISQESGAGNSTTQGLGSISEKAVNATTGETTVAEAPTTVNTETPDEFGIMEQSSETTPTTVTTPKIKTVFDFANFKHLKLTIHTEMEKNKIPAGMPHPKHVNTSTFELEGKEALKFLNAIQQDFSNNKTRI